MTEATKSIVETALEYLIQESCDGLDSGKCFEDTNSPGDILDCHETLEPADDWCIRCLALGAIWELKEESNGTQD